MSPQMNFRPLKDCIKSRFLTPSNNRFSVKVWQLKSFSKCLNHNVSLIPLKLIFPLGQNLEAATARDLNPAVAGI